MSKRNADVQLTKDDSDMMSQDTWGSGGDVPQRATAAQMAGRKLARPRGARRPQGGYHPAGATSASMQSSFPPFGQSTGSQQTSSLFRPSSNLNPQASQSFPQPSASSIITGSNSSFTAPTGSFSFSSGPTQNPFAMPEQPSSTPVKSFHGSIFNFDTPSPSAEQASGNTNPLLAPGAPGIASNVFDKPKTETNGFSWPSVTQQTQSANNIFSTPAAPQQQQTSSIFSNVHEKPKEVQSQIFGAFNAPTTQESQASKPDSLRPLTGATESQSTQNPFAGNTTTAQTEVKPNPFASIMSASNPNKNNIFAPATSNKGQTTVSAFGQDSMQTSPDNTPMKASEPLFKPFVFSQGTAETGAISPTKQPSTSQTNNLFGQSLQSKPENLSTNGEGSGATLSTPFKFPPQASTSDTQNPPEVHQASTSSKSLFDRISKPDNTTKQQSPQVSKLQPSGTGLFATPDQPKPALADAQQLNSATSQTLFAPQTRSDKITPSVPGSNARSLFRPAQEAAHRMNEPSQQKIGVFPPQSKAIDNSQSPSKPNTSRLAGSSISHQNTELDSTRIPHPPSSFTTQDREQVYIGWRLRNLDAGTEGSISKPEELDLHRLNRYYNLKRKMIHEVGDGALHSLHPAKKSKGSGFPDLSTSYQQQSLEAPRNNTSKRKADDELTQENIGQGSPSSKRARGADSNLKSKTSNLFSSIVEQNKSPSTSSEPQAVPTSGLTGTNIFKPAAAEPVNPFKSGFPSSTKTTDVQQASVSSSNNETRPNPFAKLAPASVAVKPPTFNLGSTPNFMAQFGAAAKLTAEEAEIKAKEKRKAESFDSDEDNEEEWEKKDAEEQQMKKRKLEESAKAAKPFTPTGVTPPTVAAEPQPITKPKSIFDQIHPAFAMNDGHNIFGHLKKKGIETGSEAASDEEASDDEDENKDLHKQTPARTTRPDTGSDVTSKVTSGTGSSADHTWKVDSPIKFDPKASTSSPPAINITSASASKPAGGLFGASSGTSASPARPTGGLFANLASSASSSGGAVGFGFAPAAKSAASSLVQPSANTSRATSPGATTGDSATESAAENTEDTTPNQAQLDLMSQRPGEEDEDVIFEVPRVKAWKYVPEKKNHETQGVGPLRVLKNRETGKRRVIVRQDPNNTIIINSGFVKDGKYDFIGKCRVRCVFADRNGSVSPWQIQTKDEAVSKEMGKIFIESAETGA